MQMGEADAAISVFDTKYTYTFWRPVTAIRWADDGNPATASDPGWLPYLVTPPYPDYTAAGLTRSFQTLSQAAQEGADARVYAGIHFRTGCEEGMRQGQRIGRYVFLHYLKPLK